MKKKIIIKAYIKQKYHFKFKILLSLALLILLILYKYVYFRKNKIIVVIFAGRKKYLEILLRYLRYLKYFKKISEIHFWQFTNDKSTEEYLNSLSNLHKTNGLFPYYRNIYPVIYNNYFILRINFQKNGACLLINKKYEILFNLTKDNDIIISLNVSNNLYFGKQINVLKTRFYITYIIKIIEYNIIIEDKKDLLLFIYIQSDLL